MPQHTFSRSPGYRRHDETCSTVLLLATLYLTVDCKDYVNQCHLCNMVKTHGIKHKGARLWALPSDKSECIHLDLIGSLPMGQKGERYIIVTVDVLIRY